MFTSVDQCLGYMPWCIMSVYQHPNDSFKTLECIIWRLFFRLHEGLVCDNIEMIVSCLFHWPLPSCGFITKQQVPTTDRTLSGLVVLPLQPWLPLWCDRACWTKKCGFVPVLIFIQRKLSRNKDLGQIHLGNINRRVECQHTCSYQNG